MAEDLVPAEAPDPWERLETETAAEYTSFSEFCKLGPSRSLRKLSSHLGISYDTVKIYSRKNNWIARSKALDVASSEIIAGDIDMSPSETMARQYAVGQAMLELGIKALDFKKPGSISVANAIKLIDKGADLQRKAQGLDTPGVNIHFNSKGFEAVEQMFNDYLEGEVVEDDEV